MKYLVAFLMLFFMQLKAQNTFQKVYGGTGNDKIAHLLEVENKSLLILGSTENFGANSSDILFFKIDSIGNVLWRKLIGTNGVESAIDFIKTTSGYWILGNTNGKGSGGYDFYLVRTDFDGNIISEHTFGGADWDISTDLFLCNDSSLLISGYSSSYNIGIESGYLIKTNISGDSIWTRNYDAINLEHLNSITETADSIIYSIGFSKDFGDSLGDISLRKLKPNGDAIWYRKISSPYYDEGFKIVSSSNGNLVIATHYGITDSSGVAHGNMIDTSGTILWEFETGNNTNAAFYDCVELNDGKFAFTGYYQSFNNSLGAVGNGGAEFMYSSVYSNGSFYFSGQFGYQNSDVANSILELSDNSIIIGGSTNSIGNGLYDIYIRKSHVDGYCDPNVSSNNTLSIKEQKSHNDQLFSYAVENGKLNLQFLKPINQIEIFDLQGKRISCEKNFISNQTLNINSLVTGIYFLHLTQLNGDDNLIKIFIHE